MSRSIFEKIAARELPARIIYEDDTHMAFLDINPLSAGHTLVIPKKNLGDNLFHLNNAEYQALLAFSYKVAGQLEQKLSANRILLAVEGFEVPHVHVHLIPSYGESLRDLTPIKLSEVELDAIWEKLR